MSRSVQVTPGGIRVCNDRPAPAEVLAALDELAAAVRVSEEERRGALTADARAAEDRKHAEAAERLRRVRQRARAAVPRCRCIEGEEFDDECDETCGPPT